MREEFKIINNYKNYVLNIISQSFEYDSWSDEFKKSQISEAYERFRKDLDIDFTNFSKEELLDLGFSMFDDNLIVMPLWAYHICKDGLELVSIGGDTIIKGNSEIDTDSRGGYIAYGFDVKVLLKEQRRKKLELIEKEKETQN